MPRVFVCGDTGLAHMLDAAIVLLQAQGVDIVRGPVNEVGKTRVYSPAEQVALMGDIDVAIFTIRHVCSRQLMLNAPRLRGVCYPTIGVETLDLEAANELGIIVGHGATRGNIIGMAEATIMLMLMLLYDVQTNISLLRQGQWRRALPLGRQMENKTVGLIGFGRIARAMAQRLLPFGVRILTYSPRASQADLPAGVFKADLPTVLAQSDLIALLTGLTPETRHMIGAAELKLMKPDAFLINTSRGEVVDEEALHRALREKRIAGAALDTFGIEPLPTDSLLRGLDNVILTPHAVGHTRESAAEFPAVMAENIRCMLAGELPLHCRNPQAESAWRARLQRLDQ